MGTPAAAAAAVSALVGRLSAGFEEGMPPLEAVVRDPAAAAAYSAAMQTLLQEADAHTLASVNRLQVVPPAPHLSGRQGTPPSQAEEHATQEWDAVSQVAAAACSREDALPAWGSSEPSVSLTASTVVSPTATAAIVRRRSKRLRAWAAAACSTPPRHAPPSLDLHHLAELISAAEGAVAAAGGAGIVPDTSRLSARRPWLQWHTRLPREEGLIQSAAASTKRAAQKQARQWMSGFYHGMGLLREGELAAQAPLFNSVTGMARTALPAGQGPAMLLAAITQHLANPTHVPTLEVSLLDPSVPERLTVQVDVTTGTTTLHRTPEPLPAVAEEPHSPQEPQQVPGVLPDPASLLRAPRPWHSFVTPKQYGAALERGKGEHPVPPAFEEPHARGMWTHGNSHPVGAGTMHILIAAAKAAALVPPPQPDVSLRPRR